MAKIERIVPILNPASIEEPPTTSPFEYTPIKTTVDGIRLLILEPAQDSTTLINCRLIQVTFAQKPKYEALSYTWGDETIRRKITIDGYDFTVAQNLFDALVHLQHRSEERVLWIDAICINQSDISEKNSQISFMPFIYTRAKCVLVWLGIVNAPSEQESGAKASPVAWRSIEPDPVLRTLAENPYWRRVWIIQEVGLARKILVHYGTVQREWSALIKNFRSNSETRDSLPVKLQKQIDEKYEDGHKLQALIENHRDSLCKEPRDHIYGFVGLGVDCQDGFPMDYGKSPYEVWKDVIRFKNANQPKNNPPFSEPEIDTLCFGKVVQDLLGGQGIATAEDLARDIFQSTLVDLELDEDEKTAKILVTARVSARIVHLGPTYQEIMSNFKAVATWKASMNRHLFPNEQPSAREESDQFLELLEDVEVEDLRIVESFDRDISVPKPQTPDCLLFADQNVRNFDEMQSDKFVEPEPTSTDPRLFLLGGVPDYGDESSGKVGLAPHKSRVGDYICLVHGTQKAIVVRKEEGKVRVIGTGAAAENRYKAEASKEDSINTGKRFGTTNLKFINTENRLDLYVDIATAYQLMG